MKDASLFIDLETLGTTPASVITEIGAVAFHRGDFSTLDTFESHLDIPSQIVAGRTLSAATIDFHRKHGSLPVEWAGSNREAPQDALDRFRIFVRNVKPRRVWIWGADFDRPAIEDVLSSINRGLPWHFGITRDARTVWDMAFPDVRHDPRPHRAFEDCMASIRDLRNALAELGRLESV